MTNPELSVDEFIKKHPVEFPHIFYNLNHETIELALKLVEFNYDILFKGKEEDLTKIQEIYGKKFKYIML